MKHYRLKRRVKTSPGTSVVSLDEQIAASFQEVIDEIADLDDPQMRDLWLDAVQSFATDGDVKGLHDITKWRRQPVEIEEFLFGAAYLNLERNEMYPGVMDAIHQIDTDKYDEIVMLGAIGIGKTSLANFCTARDIYKLSCMRNPHQVYGIAKGTPIDITIQSVRLSTAKKVVFDELGRHIRSSPYFMQKFPFDKNITSEMIFREHNIRVLPLSSNSSAAISRNVIGGQMDEMNFMAKIHKSKSSQADAQGSFDQARTLYNNLAARRKSRFINRGDLPGALYLISSSRFPDDFTEQKAREAAMRGGDDDRIFVFGASQWEIKGRDNRDFFTEEEFTVQIGNETYPSRVLNKYTDDTEQEREELPHPGTETIKVPMTFHKDFMRDVEGSLRDLAGVTTLATRPFIGQRDKITLANKLAKEHGYLNPLSIEEAEFSIGMPEVNKGKLRLDVDSPRHAHIDLGISKDACGIAIGHIAGHKVNRFRDEDGKEQTEILPVIGYDLILRVVPPMGGEIQLSDIRKFLRRCKDRYGIPIETVSFDGFQSVDSRQLLAKMGFRVGYLSVEKPEPWRSFRDALYDERVLLIGHNFVNKELAEVETNVSNNKEKIDHRPSGTKDVADAVVGVAGYLLSRRISWQHAAFRGGATGLFLLGDPNRNTELANVSELPVGYEVRRNPRQSLRKRIKRRRLERK